MWLHYSGAASQQMSPLGVAAHRENGGSDVENRGRGGLKRELDVGKEKYGKIMEGQKKEGMGGGR